MERNKFAKLIRIPQLHCRERGGSRGRLCLAVKSALQECEAATWRYQVKVTVYSPSFSEDVLQKKKVHRLGLISNQPLRVICLSLLIICAAINDSHFIRFTADNHLFLWPSSVCNNVGVHLLLIFVKGAPIMSKSMYRCSQNVKHCVFPFSAETKQIKFFL